MAEPRRVPLLAVKPCNKNVDRPELKKKENGKSKQKGPTLRFTLALTDSNDNSFPEFSFRDLMKKSGPPVEDEKEPKDDLFPEENDDEKLKELAKKFEDKYGPPKPGKGKKRKRELEELVDIGFGYDESDPFVDNSEAYDELVPSDWTTQYGGFYVNQGDLHYRRFSESETDIDSKDFKLSKKKKPFNKKIKAKDSVKNLSKTPKELSTQKRKKQLLNKERKQKKLEKTMETQNGEKIRKKKNSDTTPKAPKNNTAAKSSPPKTGDVTSSAIGDGVQSVKHQSTPDKSSLKDTSDATTEQAGREEKPCDGNSSSSSSPLIKLLKGDERVLKAVNGVSPDSTLNKSASEQENPNKVKMEIINVEDDKGGGQPSQPPKLPMELPSELIKCIQILKDASTATTDGKNRFFNTGVNNALLEIGKKCQHLQCKTRSVIYEHLAFYLPCTKETLIKRAKTLMIQDQTDQLEEPMKILKEAIDQSMPMQKQKYDEEIAKAVTEQVREQMQQSGLAPKLADNENERDKDGLLNEKEEQSPATPTDDKSKKNLPKRKFLWTDTLRGLLCDVVKVKVQLCKMLKSRNMTAEEYIKDFLEADVRKLWPKGWMTSRILYKESKTAHQEITQPLQKTKKATKKGDSTVNTSSINKPLDKVQTITVPKQVDKPSNTSDATSLLTIATTSTNGGPTTSPKLSIKVTAASKIKSALSSLLSPTLTSTSTTSSIRTSPLETPYTPAATVGSQASGQLHYAAKCSTESDANTLVPTATLPLLSTTLQLPITAVKSESRFSPTSVGKFIVPGSPLIKTEKDEVVSQIVNAIQAMRSGGTNSDGQDDIHRGTSCGTVDKKPAMSATNSRNLNLTKVPLTHGDTKHDGLLIPVVSPPSHNRPSVVVTSSSHEHHHTSTSPHPKTDVSTANSYPTSTTSVATHGCTLEMARIVSTANNPPFRNLTTSDRPSDVKPNKYLSGDFVSSATNNAAVGQTQSKHNVLGSHSASVLAISDAHSSAGPHIVLGGHSPVAPYTSTVTHTPSSMASARGQQRANSIDGMSEPKRLKFHHNSHISSPVALKKELEHSSLLSCSASDIPSITASITNFTDVKPTLTISSTTVGSISATTVNRYLSSKTPPSSERRYQDNITPESLAEPRIQNPLSASPKMKASAFVKRTNNPSDKCSPASQSKPHFDVNISSEFNFSYPAPASVVSSANHQASRNTSEDGRGKHSSLDSPFQFSSGLSLLSCVSSIKAPQVTQNRPSSSKNKTPPKSARYSPQSGTPKGTSPTVSRTSPLLSYRGTVDTTRGVYAHHRPTDVIQGQSRTGLLGDSPGKSSIFSSAVGMPTLANSIPLSSPQRYHGNLVPGVQGSTPNLLMQQPQIPSILSTSLLSHPLQQQQQQQQQLQTQSKNIPGANPFVGIQGPTINKNEQYPGQFPNFRQSFN